MTLPAAFSNLLCRPFSLVLGLAFLVLISGCVSTGRDLPAGQAEVVIWGQSIEAIQAKSEEVFHRHGFSMTALTTSEMRFERRGGVTDNLLYGNWVDNKTITQVTVFFVPEGEDGWRLRSRSKVLRDTFGDGSNPPVFDLQGGKYGTILRKIRNELTL
jgi:hypothetical protein